MTLSIRMSAILILLALLPGGALVPLSAQNDPQPLALASFLETVRQYHPVSQQADLLESEALANLRMAKGGFDPALYGSFDHKSFDGKNYFRIGEGGVKLPTWFGAEGKIGYNYASGVFLNPANQLPGDGQLILGASLPLLRGLAIDARRASLFEARIQQNINRTQQRLVRNDLLFEAAKAYWNWSLAYSWLQVYQEALQVASFRLDGIRTSWLMGDKPAIDTLEALVLVQDRILQRNDAAVILRQTSLELQTFLWNNGIPLPLNPNWIPEPPGGSLAVFLPQNLDPQQVAADHPAIRQYDLKLQQLEVSRRWKQEQLKPRLDLSYQMLGDGPQLRPDGNGNLYELFRENYKLGVSFGFPLLLRKERGGLELARIKILDTRLDQSQKQLEIRNKVAAYEAELRNLEQQILVASDMRDNYQRLLDGETEKFNVGESSLFLVNSRENKLLEANVKLLKLEAERSKILVALRWASGRLE
ncbi:MAG: hypothetical protein RLY31_2267 [Bacteroidota bacterium]|jgi:outer membrane protein TolC